MRNLNFAKTIQVVFIGSALLSDGRIPRVLLPGYQKIDIPGPKTRTFYGVRVQKEIAFRATEARSVSTKLTVFVYLPVSFLHSKLTEHPRSLGIPTSLF